MCTHVFLLSIISTQMSQKKCDVKKKLAKANESLRFFLCVLFSWTKPVLVLFIKRVLITWCCEWLLLCDIRTFILRRKLTLRKREVIFYAFYGLSSNKIYLTSQIPSKSHKKMRWCQSFAHSHNNTTRFSLFIRIAISCLYQTQRLSLKKWMNRQNFLIGKKKRSTKSLKYE